VVSSQTKSQTLPYAGAVQLSEVIDVLHCPTCSVAEMDANWGYYADGHLVLPAPNAVLPQARPLLAGLAVHVVLGHGLDRTLGRHSILRV
jgi:hypothetical protein